MASAAARAKIEERNLFHISQHEASDRYRVHGQQYLLQPTHMLLAQITVIDVFLVVYIQKIQFQEILLIPCIVRLMLKG